MKKLLFIGFIFVSINCFSQFGITGYIENAYGLNYKLTNRINTDIRIYANQRVYRRIPVEINVTFDIFHKDKFNFYTGLGIIVDPIKGSDNLENFVLPIGFEIKPIESLKNISLIMEIEPTIHLEDNFTVYKFFGLRYSFE
jgi:hypothetical protein